MKTKTAAKSVGLICAGEEARKDMLEACRESR